MTAIYEKKYQFQLFQCLLYGTNKTQNHIIYSVNTRVCTFLLDSAASFEKKKKNWCVHYIVAICSNYFCLDLREQMLERAQFSIHA